VVAKDSGKVAMVRMGAGMVEGWGVEGDRNPIAFSGGHDMSAPGRAVTMSSLAAHWIAVSLFRRESLVHRFRLLPFFEPCPKI
jgi:hypothetical protein